MNVTGHVDCSYYNCEYHRSCGDCGYYYYYVKVTGHVDCGYHYNSMNVIGYGYYGTHDVVHWGKVLKWYTASCSP